MKINLIAPTPIWLGLKGPLLTIKECQFRNINLFPQNSTRRPVQILFLLFCTVLWTATAFGQCPTGCGTHSTSASTASFPICGNGTTSLSGDVDNNSDCEDAGGDNCFEFVITRHDPSVTGFVADIGKGNGCNGEADIFYTEVDGICTTYASSGSQNQFNFQYGISNVLKVYICDGSSGQVSLCNLCLDCPTSKAVIEITPN